MVERIKQLITSLGFHYTNIPFDISERREQCDRNFEQITEDFNKTTQLILKKQKNSTNITYGRRKGDCK